jgi:hypothetical protein
VYLPVSVRDRLRDYVDDRRREGLTFTDVVFDAFDDQQRRLAELVGRPGGRGRGSMFQGRERLRRRHEEPQVQATLRPSPEDLKVIDQLVKDHHAGSRSALITAVLDAFLPTPPSR